MYAHRPGVTYTTEDYNKAWRATAKALLAVAPGILLVGPDLNQFTGIPAMNPKDSAGRDWMEKFLKANGDLVNRVAIHRYPFPLGSNTHVTINDLRNSSQEWDTTIP